LLHPAPWTAPQLIKYQAPVEARALKVRLRQGQNRRGAERVKVISQDATTKTWQAILPASLARQPLEIRATTEGLVLENVAAGEVKRVVGGTRIEVSKSGAQREARLSFDSRGRVRAKIQLKLAAKYPAEKYDNVKTWRVAKNLGPRGPVEIAVDTGNVKKRCEQYSKCRLTAKAKITSYGYTVIKKSDREKVSTPPEQFRGTLGFVPGDAFSGGGGQRYDYAVYVEDGIKIDRRGFANHIAGTLGDSRGWKRTGRVSFKQVKTASQADTRVILASPAMVDRLCAPLNTNGYVSCTQGSSVILNLDRWRYAVPHFKSRREYRRMVTNHEIGHRIGQGHRYCSGSGNKAPVMQQQTYGLQGCRANAWPLDFEASSARAMGRLRTVGAGSRRAWLD